MSCSALTLNVYLEYSNLSLRTSQALLIYLRAGRIMSERAICIVRRAGASLALATLISLSPAPAFASRPDSVPDWVRSAAAQTLPVYPPETDAVVLLDDTTYSVAPDGRATEHRRKVIRILRPQGRDSGIVFVPFDNDSKLRSLHVWSIAPGGHEFALKDNEIFEIGYPGQGNFYEDVKAKVARAPGRDPGGVIAYEYEQGIHPYLTETTWFFQSSLPHLSQSFTLELPAGFTFGTVWAHHAEVKSADLEHQRWRWEMAHTPGIDLSRIPMTPSEAALAGRMTIHYAGPGIPLATDGSWQSIGQWYGRLSADRLVPSPEAAAKARELAGNATDSTARPSPSPSSFRSRSATSSSSAASEVSSPTSPPTSSTTATATVRIRPPCSPPCSPPSASTPLS